MKNGCGRELREKGESKVTGKYLLSRHIFSVIVMFPADLAAATIGIIVTSFERYDKIITATLQREEDGNIERGSVAGIGDV